MLIGRGRAVIRCQERAVEERDVHASAGKDGVVIGGDNVAVDAE